MPICEFEFSLAKVTECLATNAILDKQKHPAEICFQTFARLPDDEFSNGL
jgi:hypothetical protein